MFWLSKLRKICHIHFIHIWALVFFVLAVLFIKAFFRTMQREWHGIDQLRLDKFYMVNYVLNQVSLFLYFSASFMKCGRLDYSGNKIINVPEGRAEEKKK